MGDWEGHIRLSLGIGSRDGADAMLAVCRSSSLISRLKMQSFTIVCRRRKKKTRKDYLVNHPVCCG